MYSRSLFSSTSRKNPFADVELVTSPSGGGCPCDLTGLVILQRHLTVGSPQGNTKQQNTELEWMNMIGVNHACKIHLKGCVKGAAVGMTYMGQLGIVQTKTTKPTQTQVLSPSQEARELSQGGRSFQAVGSPWWIWKSIIKSK